MKHGHHGGLYGKARRVHTERRASMKYASLLIDEYMEPDVSERRVKRVIPVVRRSNLMIPMNQPVGETCGASSTMDRSTSAAPFAYEHGKPLQHAPSSARFTCADAASRQVQLELPLGAKQTTAWMEEDKKPERVLKPVQSTASADTDVRSKQIASRAMEFHHRTAGASPERKFSIAGFLGGCLIGSAAVIALWVTLATLM